MTSCSSIEYLNNYTSVIALPRAIFDQAKVIWDSVENESMSWQLQVARMLRCRRTYALICALFPGIYRRDSHRQGELAVPNLFGL